MSILTSNEVDRLFSMVLGGDGIRSAMMARTNEELDGIDTLASSHLDDALHQVAAIGHALGAGDVDNMDANRLGWVVAHLAEYASVVSFVAETARELQDPKLRAIHKMTMGAAKQRKAA